MAEAHDTERIADELRALIQDAKSLLATTDDKSAWALGVTNERGNNRLAEAQVLVHRTRLIETLVRARVNRSVR